uniref:Uncharacterized protein n=1 Tax=Meloidogyne enterolobii TaxID=390850 RepID=A0A6V7VDF8_MELEN|nr:unnamed protein product [Meloidogyne enterolobii]
MLIFIENISLEMNYLFFVSSQQRNSRLRQRMEIIEMMRNSLLINYFS